MKMDALKSLHRSMITINADIQQFQVSTGAASFDCLFSVREEPFVLALTSRGDSPKFFKFEVKKGYWIKPYFDEFYSDLVKVLSNSGKSKTRLIPKAFLEQLNGSLPTVASIKQVATPKQVLKLRPDILEDRDKPYFDTWIYWTSENRKGPTKENLEKTLALLGRDAYQHSISMKASSRWSAVDLEHGWEKQCK